MSAVSLLNLQPLAIGTVLEVDAADEESARLKAMGICLGRRVQLVQQGDPLIVRVLGTRVGLSARLAKCVKIEALAPTADVNDPVVA